MQNSVPRGHSSRKGQREAATGDQAGPMSTSDANPRFSGDSVDGIQPLRDNDTSVEPDPALDPAQAEWDRTIAVDEGADPQEVGVTATGADPAEIPDDDDEIPAADLPGEEAQPETQGDEPLEAELGEDGQGDLAPEDL